MNCYMFEQGLNQGQALLPTGLRKSDFRYQKLNKTKIDVLNSF